MRRLHREMAQKENMKNLQEELSMNNELNVTNVNVENMTEAQADTMPVPPALQEDIPAEVLEAVQKSAEMDTTAEVETTDTSEQAEPKPVPPLPEADMDMIRKTIEVFQESDSIFEMRTFPTLGGRSGHIWVKNTPDGVERFIKTIEEENLTGASLCMTLQHINQDTEKIHSTNLFLANDKGTCTADADVDRYRFIHIDCDPERKPNECGAKSQADEEEVEHGRNKVAEVKAFLSEKGWAEPIEAFSGNGHTLDYAVDEPVNNESKVMFKKLLEVLKDKFADEFVKIDTTVSSSGQIIKLYGCVSCKGKHTADRPYRVTKLLHVPENREFVTAEQVQSLINELDVKTEKKKSVKPQKTSKDKGKCAKIAHVADWLDYYHIDYDMTEEEYEGEQSRKFVLEDCPANKHDNHKCAALFQFANGNVLFNCFHDHCQEFTIHNMLKKYPLVNQIPLMQGDKDIMLIYNEVVSNSRLITADDNQHYILTDKNEVVHFDSSEAGDYIVTQAQNIDLLPSKNMVTNIKLNLNAKYEEYAVHATVAERAAYKDDTLYYTLNKGNSLRINSQGIEAGNQLCNNLYFHYSSAFSPQCEPDLETPATDLPELVKQTFNITEEYMPSFLAQLVCFYMPHINTPLLVLSGGQGTSKSTTSRKIKSLVDPTAVDIQSLPEKLDSLYTALSGNYLVAFDNIDKISAEYSSVFCIACTGGVAPKRKLFTDNDKVTIKLHTKIILNGIGDIISKNDLAERINIIYLDTIMKRRTENQVWKEFDELKPKMLGAIFNCIKEGLGYVEEMEKSIENLPRMADFCVYGAAFIKAMGLDWMEFVKQYTNTTTGLIAEQTQQDDFTILLSTFLDEHEKEGRTFTGTAQQLLEGLTNTAKRHHLPMEKFIPTTLSRKLNQSEVSLRAADITMTKGRGTKRLLTLTKETEALHPATAEKVKEYQKDIEEWYDDTPEQIDTVPANKVEKPDKNQQIAELLNQKSQEIEFDENSDSDVLF